MRELALHILDLVQNSVEAGATHVALTISEDSVADRLTIRVADDGCGMDETIRGCVLDPLYTTRLTRRVGLGLPLIDMSTIQCGGRLLITSTPGQGTTVEASWRLGHLDRPPLGNMAVTMKTLIVGNPNLDLCYTHQVGSRSFVISVLELQEILNGIPFTQPDVLLWLDAYLSDSELQVYGGVLNENG